ncbi:MAG: nitronate monooxygenase [bacterium]
MKNELTEKLGIKYPVVQGGMMEISRSPLVAAVSNAGGLGTLGQRMELSAWQEEVKKTKELTDKPFSVNLPLHMSDLEQRLEVILDEGVKVVTTAAGNPARVMETLKEAGITVLHVVGTAAQAEKVEKAGVDVIVAEGGESGGMVGKDRVATMVLVPEVAGRVKVPVVAAGGICDARGLVAALALGAGGVQVGTGFLVAKECDASEQWKQAVCKAKDTDTQVVPRGSAQGRVLKDEIMKGAMAGIVSGMIDEQKSARQIVEAITGPAYQVLDNVTGQLKE